LFLRRKNVPEPQRLVAGAGNQGLAVGAGRQVQDTVGVACERRNLLHGGVAPNVDLVLAVSVSRYQLIYIFCEHEIAHLAACLHRLQIFQLDGVPELYCAVLGTASRRQQALLVGRPGDGFDCGLMVVELRQGLGRATGAPQHKFIIISPRSQLLVVERPL